MMRATRLLTFVTALTALPVLAMAGVSQWADNPGGRMRIVVLPPDKQGIVKGALEIEPASGWITYWREPGEAGTPPQMTMTPDSGYTLQDMRFPAPQVFKQNGVRDIGYSGPVALPFTLSAQDPAKAINANVFIGVCKEICIPFQAEFNLAVTGDEAEAGAVVTGAESRLPEPPSADFSAEAPRGSADNKTVSVNVTLPANEPEPEFFLTGPEGYVYLDPALAANGANRTDATFTLDELPNHYDLRGKTWRLLVKSGARAMETTLVFD